MLISLSGLSGVGKTAITLPSQETDIARAPDCEQS
jgi:hypothetical protein